MGPVDLFDLGQTPCSLGVVGGRSRLFQVEAAGKVLSPTAARLGNETHRWILAPMSTPAPAAAADQSPLAEAQRGPFASPIAAAPVGGKERVASIDAYRGFVM